MFCFARTERAPFLMKEMSEGLPGLTRTMLTTPRKSRTDELSFRVMMLATFYLQGLLQRGAGKRQRDPLKKPGYIPLVSTVTGAYRVAKGVLTLCSDCVVFPIISIAHYIIARNEKDSVEKKRMFKELPTQVRDTFRAFAIDISNIVRGIVEMVPVAGNITCIAYDKLSDWYLARRNQVCVIRAH